MPSRVTVYYSSVSGNLMIKKKQMRVQDILLAKKIEFDLVDVAADEEGKLYMQRKSGKTLLPQIFVDGEFKSGHDELDEANEVDEVLLLLGLEPVNPTANGNGNAQATAEVQPTEGDTPVVNGDGSAMEVQVRADEQ
ncbi:hypothetical protein HK102_007574 [Quaeritorhiza haematococci]|nr:hypothetical protein HK102_007574 [Quaeritorhiza haematococci]